MLARNIYTLPQLAPPRSVRHPGASPIRFPQAKKEEKEGHPHPKTTQRQHIKHTHRQTEAELGDGRNTPPLRILIDKLLSWGQSNLITFMLCTLHD